MSWTVAALGLLAVVAVGTAVGGPWSPVVGVAGLALAGLTAAAWRTAISAPALRVATLAVLVAVASIVVPLWQAAAALALVAFRGAGWADGRLSSDELWVVGRVPPGPTALAALVTPVPLVAWVVLARPDLQDVLELYVPPIPLVLLLVGALLFTLTNAVLEELIWRGVFHQGLRAVGGVRFAIGVGALSFGLQHAGGFPRGVVGVALAAGWGVLLGWLRERSGGLLAPILAHLVADATIAWIVLFLVA
jgi:uncharacterized protein